MSDCLHHRREKQTFRSLLLRFRPLVGRDLGTGGAGERAGRGTEPNTGGDGRRMGRGGGQVPGLCGMGGGLGCPPQPPSRGSQPQPCCAPRGGRRRGARSAGSPRDRGTLRGRSLARAHTLRTRFRQLPVGRTSGTPGTSPHRQGAGGCQGGCEASREGSAGLG